MLRWSNYYTAREVRAFFLLTPQIYYLKPTLFYNLYTFCILFYLACIYIIVLQVQEVDGANPAPP